MKKIILLLACLFVLAGCKKENSENQTNKYNDIEIVQVYKDAFMKMKEHSYSMLEETTSSKYYTLYFKEGDLYKTIYYSWDIDYDEVWQTQIIAPAKDYSILEEYISTGEEFNYLYNLAGTSNLGTAFFLDNDKVVIDRYESNEDQTLLHFYYNIHYVYDEGKVDYTNYTGLEVTIEDGCVVKQVYEYYIDGTYSDLITSSTVYFEPISISYEEACEEAWDYIENKTARDTYQLGNIDLAPVVPYEAVELVQEGTLTLPQESTNYTFDLTLDPTTQIVSGHCKIAFISNFEENYFVIRDYQAAYNRETEYSNITSNYGNTTISRDENEPTKMNIQVENPIHNGEEVVVEFDLSIPLNGFNDEYGYQEAFNAYSLGYNLPILAIYEKGEFIVHPMVDFGEPAYSDMANYLVNITVPEGYNVAGSGNKRVNNQNYTFEAKAVRDVAYIISDQFVELEGMVGNTKIISYGYDEETAKKYLDYSITSLIELNERFTPYPYDSLSVVAWEFENGAGGKEYPQLIQIGLSTNNVYNTIYHEICHQYFYNIVGNDQYNEAWLDESIASYLTNRRNVEEQMIITRPYNTYIFTGQQEDENGNLVDYIDHYNYTLAIYYCGNRMFYELEDRCGSDLMNKMLKTYILTFGFENVKSEDLVYVIKEVLGEDSYDIIKPYIQSSILVNVYGR